MKIKNCIQCGEKITYTDNNRGDFCNNVCEADFRNKDNVENRDYVTCAICSFKSPALAGHIKRSHNITTEEYREKYKCETVSLNYKENASYLVAGSKNPGYQHRGKLSAFSDNFIHKKDNTKEKARAASKKTKSLNPHNENTKMEYYTSRGMSREDAELALKERQTTFSLEKCVTQHGEEKGTEIWLDRQEKWQNTLNSKSEEEITRINRLKMSISAISKPEIELRNSIYNYINGLEYQFTLMNNDKRSYIYDIKHNNKIIEFNGDYWHANPNTKNWKNESKLHSQRKKTAKEIWEYDKNKIQVATNNGYDILVIWEADYKKDKEKAIKECINFLTQ